MKQYNFYGIMGVLIAAFILTGCETTPVQEGAFVGSVLGGATGAVIGHQSGDATQGALIGAGAGGVLGALIGDDVARNQPRPVVSAPPPAPVPSGHYEYRTRRGPTGERYEERVWVPGY